MQHLFAARPSSRTTFFSRLIPAFLTSYVACMGIASADTFTVSNENELIAALQASSSNQQNDVINLAGSVIELTSTLDITNEDRFRLAINGGTIRPAADETPFRLLRITDRDLAGLSSLALNSMTFENGRYDTSTGPLAEAGGAAIYSAGIPVQVTDSTFNNNVIVGNGAGGAILVSNSSLSIEISTFNRNQAIAMGFNALTSGGAIATVNGSQISVSGTTFNNSAASRGGAIAPVNQTGTTVILGSTFTNNEAETLGGAIWARSKIEITLSTFYRNNAGIGGGALYLQPINTNASGSFLNRNTLVANAGGNIGGAIFFDGGITRPELSANLIIGTGLTNNPNCADIGISNDALFAFEQNNISDDGTCGSATVIQNGAELFTLGTPQSNGGLTQTIALQPESIAIDAGGAQGEVGCTTTVDQRGFNVIDNCDVGSFEFEPIILDGDDDGIIDDDDNCPVTSNPNQNDFDEDGTGDACDDSDLDSVNDDIDNCPTIANTNQLDLDEDGLGDLCDLDIDGDGVDNDSDRFPLDDSESVDTDGDGRGDRVDTDDDNDSQSDVNELACGSDPLDAASISADADEDGIPDCVDNDFVPDADGDGFNDNIDNCPVIANPDQIDTDRDGDGNVCDDDDDNDGVLDADDRFPLDETESVDTDGDGRGDRIDTDDDNDSQSDVNELACGSDPLDAASISADADEDGIPDCVDNDFVPDTDGPQPVTVYQHINFRGNSISVGEGDVSFRELRDSIVGNDQISSIEIAPGYEVVACQHGGFRGRCETFTGSVSDLRRISFNDIISSLRISKVPTTPVTLYQHVNFRGNSFSVGEGEVSFRELRDSTVGNDQISSIEIAPGYEVVACQHGGFRGRCETFTGSVSDLRGINFNDIISSLRIQQQ